MRWGYGLLALGLLVGLWGCSGNREDAPASLTVSAAANLTFALRDIGAQFTRETGTRLTFNFGASGQLTQQIAQGAPVDVFAAANVALVEQLARRGLVLDDTLKPYARGRLTLWTRADSGHQFARVEDLIHPSVRRVAIANPTHAPYGVAARQALQTAGLWTRLQPKLVMGENVRQTLQYAATGNVDVAIVALSLSVQHEGRWVILPEALHQPIVQALAVLKRTRHAPQARAFAAYVRGDSGQAILRRYGFQPYGN